VQYAAVWTAAYCVVTGPTSWLVVDMLSVCLQSQHNDTVSKLDFVLSLSELVINIARLRTSPLSSSSASSAGNQLRRVEQLVLNLHALQLLASSLQLARCELEAGRLQLSSTVRNSAYCIPYFLHWPLLLLVVQYSSVMHVRDSHNLQILMFAHKLLFSWMIGSSRFRMILVHCMSQMANAGIPAF